MARKTPPLSPNLPMVDENGLPTPFFMRWWQDQARTNAIIPDLTTPEGVTTVLDVLDAATTAPQGSVIFRGATNWETLGPGVAGQFLQSQGASLDAVWATPVTAWLGLSDTPSTYTGQQGRVPKVNAGETSLEFTSLSALLDQELGSAQGAVAYRGASGWVTLGPGTSGQFLKTQGASANPIWDTVAPGASTFLSLSDTPANYTGDALKYVRVNAGATALEFLTPPTIPANIDDLGDVDTSTVAPTDGQALVWVAADSEWQPGTVASGGGGGGALYDIASGFETTPTSSEIIEKIMLGREVTFPADFAGIVGDIDTNPTASFDILVKDDGVTIGTITISTGGAFSAVTVSNTEKVVAAGSKLTFEAPASADATAAGAVWTLLGTVV